MAKTALIYDIEPQKFIDSLASKLASVKEFEMPEWAKFIKTGTAKERPPHDNDWWQKRTASILRKLYVKGTIGISRLRAEYSSKKNMGMKPERVYKGGGKIIRTILQQAERADFVEKKKEGRLGRELTKKGLEFLNKVAEEMRTG